MLYQLTIYAASHEGKSATILYPTTDSGAKEARIAVQDPVFGRSAALVNVRPVLLPVLENLVMSPNTPMLVRNRRTYAESLLDGVTRGPRRPIEGEDPCGECLSGSSQTLDGSRENERT